MQKTTSNKIIGTVDTLKNREQIMKTVKTSAPYAKVKFRARGNGATTTFADAEYFTVTVQMGNSYLSTKSLKNLNKYVKTTR